MRLWCLSVVLFSCSAKPVEKADADLLARQACVRELNAPTIHSVADFLELAKKKDTESLEEMDPPKKLRLGRCALAAFEAATAADPGNPEAEVAAAEFYLKRAEFAKAAAHYQSALAIDPAIPGVNLRLSQIARLTGNTRKAYAYAELELREHPDCIDAFRELAELNFADNNFEESSSYYGEIIRRDPRSYFAFCQRAVSERSLRKYPEAIADLRRAQRLMPREPGLEFEIAQIYQVSGASREAIRAYRRYLKLIGTDNPSNRAAAERQIELLERK